MNVGSSSRLLQKYKLFFIRNFFFNFQDLFSFSFLVKSKTKTVDFFVSCQSKLFLLLCFGFPSFWFVKLWKKEILFSSKMENVAPLDKGEKSSRMLSFKLKTAIIHPYYIVHKFLKNKEKKKRKEKEIPLNIFVFFCFGC